MKKLCVSSMVLGGKLVVLSTAVALLVGRPALAFKPNDAGHLGITSEVLLGILRVIGDETLKFSDRAVKQIRNANKDTNCLQCQADASLHFDDEVFTAGTTRLANLKASIITKITASSPDGASAGKDLGTALHTLQDFYAHSNWVELGNSRIDSRLGRSTFAGLHGTIDTCFSDPGTPSGAALTSGWFRLPLCLPP